VHVSAVDPANRLLAFLRREPVVSGERLSGRLGISRAAVWKQVEQLRARGYRIEAQHARGYRLAGVPDRLLPAEITARLTARRLGRRIVYFEATDSTNVQAMRLAREGAPEGTLVVAERQTQGRGRLGRAWSSPDSVNLYASWILRPTLAPAAAPQLSLAAAVALARALAPLAPGLVTIKWPNDCLLGGRKVAGILTEMDAELDRVRAVVLGIGVNLNATARAFPPELRATATSVRLATGRRVDRIAFTAALCDALEAVYDRLLQEGFGALIAEWNDYSCLTGREVTVECAGHRTTGVVRGLDASGRLVLARDGARAGVADERVEHVEHIVAGDVTVIGGYAAIRPVTKRADGGRTEGR
jgi:BirA family biotin operon repressor/biotin-[acetyl-CoA-carboxylase] ligase